MRNSGLLNKICLRFSGYMLKRQTITHAMIAGMLLCQTTAWAASDDKPQLLELPSAPADTNATQKPQVPAGNTTLQLLPLPETATAPAATGTPAAVQPVAPTASVPPSPSVPAQNTTSTIAAPAAPVANAPAIPHPAPLPANNNNAAIPAPVPQQAPVQTNAATASPVVVPGPDKPVDSDHGTSSSHDSTLTLMFTSDEMAGITKILKIYDSYDEHKQSPTTITPGDIFGDNEPATPVAQEQVVKLPNVYCGSIVYYSPQTWLVTINGKKLTNAKNTPGTEFYISDISRKEIVLVWKPHALNDVPSIWNQKTDDGKNPLPNIKVDTAAGTITLHIRPNQTFIPDTLEIREGLVKPGGFFAQIKNAIKSVTSGK